MTYHIKSGSFTVHIIKARSLEEALEKAVMMFDADPCHLEVLGVE